MIINCSLFVNITILQIPYDSNKSWLTSGLRTCTESGNSWISLSSMAQSGCGLPTIQFTLIFMQERIYVRRDRYFNSISYHLTGPGKGDAWHIFPRALWFGRFPAFPNPPVRGWTVPFSKGEPVGRELLVIRFYERFACFPVPFPADVCSPNYVASPGSCCAVYLPSQHLQ